MLLVIQQKMKTMTQLKESFGPAVSANALLHQIKADQLQLRKQRNPYASALTTLIGEAESVGKNAGNRSPTDDEVLTCIRKTLKNLAEFVTALGDKTSDDEVRAAKRTSLIQEQTLLSAYLPMLLTEQQLTEIITALVAADPTAKMGKIMGALKAAHSGLYDGVIASKIVNGLVAK